MRVFGSLVLTLAVLVNFIDCLHVRQFPPSGQLPGHPDYTFFTVLPEDFSDAFVEVNNGPLIKVEEPLLAVSQNNNIVGWMDGMNFRPIYNEDRQKISISIETGRAHVMDIHDQFIRERSRTPPNYMRNRQYRAETPPSHNIIMRDRTETPPDDKTIIRDRSRTPRNHGSINQGPPTTLLSALTIMENRSETSSNYNTIIRDRLRTPPIYGTANQDSSRNPPKTVTNSRDRSETPPYHNTNIRDRLETRPNYQKANQDPSSINLNDVKVNEDRARSLTKHGKANLDRSGKPEYNVKVNRERSRSPRQRRTYQTN